jgi:hypothetical protein
VAGDVEGYEQLRCRVLQGDGTGWRMGLAVLQHRGVAAWLRVCHGLSNVVRVERDRAVSAWPVPAGTADQLVGVLACMALGALGRGDH